MTQENVRVLEQLTDAFNRRDTDAIQKLWHPEGEFTSSVADIEGTGGVYRASEVSNYVAELDSLFEGWRIEDANFGDVDHSCVVLIQRVTGRARGSGVPIDQRIGVVWTFRDGLLFSGRVFVNPQDALDAVGLSEQDARGPD
jgi:ketosteroid isomerase-like protein